MSPAPSRSLALSRVKLGNALEIRDRIIFDFYPGLPHIYASYTRVLARNLPPNDAWYNKQV